jgi:hypothetical protein
MNKDRIKEITLKLMGEFHERKILHLTPREIEFPDISNKIQVAIGMRRIRKTSFLF